MRTLNICCFLLQSSNFFSRTGVESLSEGLCYQHNLRVAMWYCFKKAETTVIHYFLFSWRWSGWAQQVTSLLALCTLPAEIVLANNSPSQTQLRFFFVRSSAHIRKSLTLHSLKALTETMVRWFCSMLHVISRKVENSVYFINIYAKFVLSEPVRASWTKDFHCSR